MVDYTDPAGPGNSYLFRQYRNGRLHNTIFLQNDQLTDGNHLSQILRTRAGGSDDANERPFLKELKIKIRLTQ